MQVGGVSTLSLEPITNNQTIEQQIGGMDGEITHVGLFTATYERMNSADVPVELVSCETNTVLSESRLDIRKGKKI